MPGTIPLPPGDRPGSQGYSSTIPEDLVPIPTLSAADDAQAVDVPAGVRAADPSGYVLLPDVPPPPYNPVLALESPYREYWLTVSIVDHSGLKLVPLAGPVGTPARVVRRRAPSGKRQVWWVAKRRGPDRPQVPSRQSNANEVYLWGVRSICMNGHLIDGSKATCVSGYMELGLRVPPSESDVIQGAAGPHTTEIASDNAIRPEDYILGILGVGPPPAGAPADVIAY